MNPSPSGLDYSPPRSFPPKTTTFALILLFITLLSPTLAQPGDLQIVDTHGPRSSLLDHHHDNHKRTQSQLPQPFDTSLSDNFTTSSCPSFFTSFLSNSTVSSCHAISLLLRDSTSFFHILSSRPATSRTLDAACSAPFDTCSTIFTHLASSLVSDKHCKQDYELGNPLVRNALYDFRAYDPLYKSTCLSNPVTENYCFVDAVFSNFSADYNVYFVPLGVDLPPQTGNLTCNDCLMATMETFASYASRDGQPLVESYLPSAKIVNRVCGNGFADLNVSLGDVKAFAKESLGVPVLPDASVWGWIWIWMIAILAWFV